MLSYTVQLYLPRLPWQTDLIPQVPVYNLWFVGLVGRFGWLDYSFPRLGEPARADSRPG